MARFMTYFFVALLALVFVLAGYSAFENMRVEAAHGPLGSFVEVDGVQLHYVDQAPEGGGDGAPIVLIHGASGNLRDFMVSILPELAKRHRVIAFDRPGHGWSGRPARDDVHDPRVQAQIIHEAVKKLRLEKPLVLGHSWGGAVAVAYALAFGDELTGVAVMSGATHPWAGGTAWYHDVVKLPVIGEFFLRTLVVPAGKFLAGPGVVRNFAPDPAPPGFADEIGLDLLFRPDNFRYNSQDTRHLKTILAEMSPGYDAISVPTLIMTGNRDQTVLAKIHSYVLHEQVTGSEMIKLQNTGHMPHHAHRDVIVEALTRLAMTGEVTEGMRVVGTPSPPPNPPPQGGGNCIETSL